MKYGYNLANEQKTITYPNGKEVAREYDNAGRLKKITDWLGNSTVFSYDPDSNLTKTTFPASTAGVDEYAYDPAGRMRDNKITNAQGQLASVSYARDVMVSSKLRSAEDCLARKPPNTPTTKTIA